MKSKFNRFLTYLYQSVNIDFRSEQKSSHYRSSTVRVYLYFLNISNSLTKFSIFNSLSDYLSYDVTVSRDHILWLLILVNNKSLYIVCLCFFNSTLVVLIVQCPPLNRITLGKHKSDNNNRMIQLTDVFVYYIGT